jgi:glycosyltransferase involved in cell wall biosynthesis
MVNATQMDSVDHPLISVIMPAYNTEKYIAEAIESILDQNYPHFELLICDDGSTDGTLDIVKKYGAKDPRIKYFYNKKNIGNLKTTNFLFDQCIGKYICVQDSDDISDKNRLEYLLIELESNIKLGVVGSNYVLMDINKNAISSSILPRSNKYIQSLLTKEVPPILWGACMFRKEILQKTGYFRPVFNRIGFADLDLLYRMCELSECKNLNLILYFYRKSSQIKYPQKGIIVKNGLELLVKSHHLRINGQKDFLEPVDHLAIRQFVGKKIFRKAEQSHWQNKHLEAVHLYAQSIIVYPFNITALKNIIKIILKRNKIS